MAAHPLPVGELEHVVAQLGSDHGGPTLSYPLSYRATQQCSHAYARTHTVIHTCNYMHNAVSCCRFCKSSHARMCEQGLLDRILAPAPLEKPGTTNCMAKAQHSTANAR